MTINVGIFAGTLKSFENRIYKRENETVFINAINIILDTPIDSLEEISNKINAGDTSDVIITIEGVEKIYTGYKMQYIREYYDDISKEHLVSVEFTK